MPPADPHTQLASLLPPQAGYVWSWLSIWEQVTTNVLTVVVIGGGGALVALVSQHFFNFIVIPANVLLTIALASAVVLLLIIAVALLVRRYMAKHPFASLVALMAIMIGMSGRKTDHPKTWDQLLIDALRTSAHATPPPSGAAEQGERKV